MRILQDILIEDGSLVAEMCSVLYCGFPLYSTYSAAFPSVLDQSMLQHIHGVKAFDFARHISGEAIVSDTLLRADGYKYASGWYLGVAKAEECINRLTGCAPDDVSCHDRYALEHLVRGPFKPKVAAREERIVVGAPPNFKHGILNLPHSFSPRLDAAVHLRCQFQQFEQLVGE